jgi:hypothetical protein
MDRQTAERSVRLGLLLGGIAVCIFALTFGLAVVI